MHLEDTRYAGADHEPSRTSIMVSRRRIDRESLSGFGSGAQVPGDSLPVPLCREWDPRCRGSVWSEPRGERIVIKFLRHIPRPQSEDS